MKRLLLLVPLLAACGAAPKSPPAAPSSVTSRPEPGGGAPSASGAGPEEKNKEEETSRTTTMPAAPPPPPAQPATAVGGPARRGEGALGAAPGGMQGASPESAGGSTLDQARPGDGGRTSKASDSQGSRNPDSDHGRPNETAAGKSDKGLTIRAVPLAGQLNKQPFQAAAALVTTSGGRTQIEIFDQARGCDDKTTAPNRLSLRLPSWVPSVAHEMPAGTAFFVIGSKNQPARRAVFELPLAPNPGERGKLRLLLASSTAGNEVEGEIEFLRCD